MTTHRFTIGSAATDCLFDVNSSIGIPFNNSNTYFLITDEHVKFAHPHLFANHKHTVIPSGESIKVQSTIDRIIAEMLRLKLDRSVVVVGIGGGVVTDLAGFVASIYKRGTTLMLMPTTILGMVDAAIGGKNGINVGDAKNMVGTIHQPTSIFFDYSLLTSLPDAQWRNGFAEIIKHAISLEPSMLDILTQHSLSDFQQDRFLLGNLIERNVFLKMKVIAKDPNDFLLRHVLNFGHTLGHAIEQLHDLPHGEAVSIGMMFVCQLSEKKLGLDNRYTQLLSRLLHKYSLPIHIQFVPEQVLELMKNDKKNEGVQIRMVLLREPGLPEIHHYSCEDLLQELIEFNS